MEESYIHVQSMRLASGEEALLAVDEQPVEAGGLAELADVDGARQADAEADSELAGSQLAQGVVGDGGHLGEA